MQELLVLMLAALPLAFVVYWWVRRNKAAADAPSSRPRTLEALDTLQAWTPEPSRILTSQERQAYGLLRAALPDYMVLAQVPLARFLRVPTRNSYAEWMRRVGQVCADLVICNGMSEVVAVVEIRAPSDMESERGARRHARMDRVLASAGIKLHVWRENRLPSAAEVRLMILGETADAAATARPLHGSTMAPVAGLSAARPAAVRAPLLDDDLPEMTELEHDHDEGQREPPPSTWFDDLDPEPMPVQPAGRVR